MSSQQPLRVLGEIADDAVEHGHQRRGALAQSLVGALFAQTAQAVYRPLVQAERVIVIALQRPAARLCVRRVEAEQEVRRRAEIARDGADRRGRGRGRSAALGL